MCRLSNFIWLSSEFGNHLGLNLINGKSKKIPNEKYKGAKLPNVGWFKIKYNLDNQLFNSVNKKIFFILLIHTTAYLIKAKYISNL